MFGCNAFKFNVDAGEFIVYASARTRAFYAHGMCRRVRDQIAGQILEVARPLSQEESRPREARPEDSSIYIYIYIYRALVSNSRPERPLGCFQHPSHF